MLLLECVYLINQLECLLLAILLSQIITRGVATSNMAYCRRGVDTRRDYHVINTISGLSPVQ